MCRSIKTLRGDPLAGDEDVLAGALQFVRKISGYRTPSKANEAVFAAAVEEIALCSQRLLDGLGGPTRRSGAKRSSSPVRLPMSPPTDVTSTSREDR